MITILLLASNPMNSPTLRLDAETREIENALREADLRDRFVIEKQFAVRVSDLQSLLMRFRPHIVHFCGHGSGNNEIIVENAVGSTHPIPVEALSELFALLGDNTHCVVLNVCHSEEQARAIGHYIGCVVGMADEIEDDSAIAFARAFYRALGFGKSLQDAFRLGCLEIAALGLPGQGIPVLVKNGSPGGLDNLIIDSSADSAMSAEIRKIMYDRFAGDSAGFDAFCRQYFPTFEYQKNLAVLWAIELLITDCRRQQRLELLYSTLFVGSPWRRWFGSIGQAIGFRRKKSGPAGKGRRTQVELTIEFPFESVTPEIIAAGINAMAYESKIPPSQIRIREMRQGSTILKLDVPSEFVDRLMGMYESDRTLLLRNLGVSYLVETPDNAFQLENVHTLFSQGFGQEQLIRFCEAHAAILALPQPVHGSATEVTDQLLEQALAKGKMPELLTLAQAFAPQAYNQHRPYYRDVRRPNHRGSSAGSKATRRELIVAALRGFGLSFAGAAVLSLLTFWFYSFPTTTAMDLIFTFFTGMISLYLGDIVGAQIVAGSQHKNDPRLGKVAVVTFLLGFLSGFSYPMMFLMGFDYFDNKLVLALITLCLVPLVIALSIFLLIIYSFISGDVVTTLSGLLNLALGGFAAYRSAKRAA